METVGSSVDSGVGCPWEFCHANKTAHTKKKTRGAAHFAAQGLHMGNGVGCPWAAHGNFAMQIRLPTISIYGNSGQLSRQSTASKILKKKVDSGVGCSMGILPCKLGCPLLPYKETVGSSVGSPLLPNMKKWAGQLAVEWAAQWEVCHANKAAQ